MRSGARRYTSALHIKNLMRQQIFARFKAITFVEKRFFYALKSDKLNFSKADMWCNSLTI